jgi:hypothetical protein
MNRTIGVVADSFHPKVDEAILQLGDIGRATTVSEVWAVPYRHASGRNEDSAALQRGPKMQVRPALQRRRWRNGWSNSKSTSKIISDSCLGLFAI